MKAVGLYRYLPLSHPEALLDLELPKPAPAGRDLLVAVKAVAVKPVDYKIRAPKDKVESEPRVLGWDASGVVESVGPECTLFRPGDAVFYAGSVTRPGCDSEFHLVDERIVGRKPSTLDDAQAAALPLTSITAWEALFDRLGVADEPAANAGKVLLIIAGAGGVGSIATQLAKRVAGLTVVATASRPESAAWCRTMGADHVIDHSRDMGSQMKELGMATVDFILCLNNTDAYFGAMAELIAPQGRICSIVENRAPLEMGLLKNKSAGFVWEFMFTRSMYQTRDMIAQHHLLNRIADLMDAGVLRTTLGEVIGPVTAASLKLAHGRLEGGKAIGKLVLAGFA